MTNGVVVVLGKTGRNFAAGMSGGVAYVLDETGEFAASLCNRDMVDLDEPDAADRAMIEQLIRRHKERTGSPRAGLILDRWNAYFPHFVKVFPCDFKRALAAAALAQTRTSGRVEEVGVG